MVVYKVDRAKNDVVMDMPLVNMRRKDVFMLPLCYRVGKLPPDLITRDLVYFPRLKGLYQVVGEVVSLRAIVFWVTSSCKVSTPFPVKCGYAHSPP